MLYFHGSLLLYLDHLTSSSAAFDSIHFFKTSATLSGFSTQNRETGLESTVLCFAQLNLRKFILQLDLSLLGNLSIKYEKLIISASYFNHIIRAITSFHQSTLPVAMKLLKVNFHTIVQIVRNFYNLKLTRQLI